MNTEGALLHLATTTSDAVRGVLSSLAPEAVTGRAALVVGDPSRAFDGLDLPAVAAGVAYADGVEGGSLLVMPVGAARRLAAAMLGTDPADVVDAEPISEAELSAAGEALDRMLSAAAAATGTLIGQEVPVTAADTRVVHTAQELQEAHPVSGQATLADFALFGFGCRLVQPIAPAVAVALEDALGVAPGAEQADPLRATMLDVSVRVWAELGRTRMSSARAVALPPGAVVELDRAADDAIDLYVDGLHFAMGRLIVTDEGELAIRLETVGMSPRDGDAGPQALPTVDKALS